MNYKHFNEDFQKSIEQPKKPAIIKNQFKLNDKINESLFSCYNSNIANNRHKSK